MTHALIIGDNMLIARAVQDRLTELGFDSFERSWTEDDAVAAAKRHEPELVVIGEHLITGSPIEAARRIARTSDAVMLLVARPGFPEKHLPIEASLNGPFALEQIDSAVSAAKSLHHPAMEQRQPLFAA